MKKIAIEEAVAKMKEVLSKSCNEHEVPWIITKVLRINMKQYEFITEITSEQFDRCLDACNEVNSGKSVADIFGVLEFCGNYFEVRRDVFYPRLSTECLIEAVKTSYDEVGSILDVCTGSGCIAITLAQIFKSKTLGVDISQEACRLACTNAKRMGVDCSFLTMDVKKEWSEVIGKQSQLDKFDIIVSNPPYWTHEQLILNKDKMRNNPENAFDGGDTGLDFYEVIIENAPKYLNTNGMLFLEIDPVIKDGVLKLLEKDFKDVKLYKDYLGNDRVVSVRLK